MSVVVPDAAPSVTGDENRWSTLIASWLLAFDSKHTRAAYRNDALAWSRWLAQIGCDPFEVQRVQVDAWARKLADDGLAAATIARKLASVSSLYGYATDERLIDRNPAARVRRPRPPAQSSTRYLSLDEMRRFIETARNESPRDYLIALLLSLSGLRSEELRSLRIEEIGAYGEFTTIVVHGKGGTFVRVPLPEVTADALEAHVEGKDRGYVVDGGLWRGWQHGDNTATVVPVEDTADVDMSAAQLRRIITRIANRAGLNDGRKAITPHSFRHSAITAAAEAGVEDRYLEVFARHSDPRSTRRYTRTSDDFNRHASLVLAKALLAS